MKNKIRRINLLGEPNTGKSVLASHLYSEFSSNGYSVELVREYVKKWVFEERKPESFDQVYIFAKQLRKEDLILRNDVDFIITGSPIILTCFYTSLSIKVDSNPLEKIAEKFENQYPSVNILLSRGDISYKDNGRYHDKNESKILRSQLKNYMDKRNIKYTEFKATESNNIVDFIKSKGLQNDR